MAYRNTIISLAALVAFGTACSKAPSYDATTKTGSSQPATADLGTEGTDHEHGAAADDKVASATPAPSADAAKAPETKPATPPVVPPPAATPPAAPAAVKADPVKQMANNTLFTVTRVTNAVGWGSTATAPVMAPIAVDAAGVAIRSAITAQTVVKLNPNDPNQLMDAQGAPLKPATLSSLMVICNDTTTPIQLHSSVGGAGIAHGNGNIGQGACAAYGLQAATQAAFNTAARGATYDHTANPGANDPKSNVYIKLQKIGPTGAVVP